MAATIAKTFDNGCERKNRMPRPRLLLTNCAVLIAVGAYGCVKRNPYKCNLAEPCPLAEAPFCDIAGDFGEPYHCVPMPAVDGGLDDASTVADGSSGDGGAPGVLEVTPFMVDFGASTVGAVTNPSRLSIRNTGQTTLQISPLTIEGTDRLHFEFGTDRCSGATLNPSDACSVDVTFHPTSAGSKTGTLLVASPTPGVGSVSVPLTGSAVSVGALRFNMTSVSFLQTIVGSSTTSRVTLMNSGGTTSGVIAISFAGSNASDMSLVNDSCTGNTLAANASCVVDLRFLPGEAGQRIASALAAATPGGTATSSLQGTAAATLQVGKLGDGSGTVASSPAGISCGVTCSLLFTASPIVLTVTPAAGTNIGAWSGCTSTPAADSCSVRLDAANKSVSIALAQRRVALTVALGGAGSGTVVSTPAGIMCPSASCNAMFDEASTVALEAKPTTGSHFVGWTGACTGSGRFCTVSMTQALSTTATFEPVTHNLVFVSSMTFPTNLGGVGAYDSRCNTLATAAGINNASNDGYVALMSSDTESAVAHLGSARGFVRTDGKPLADTPSSLLTDLVMYYPIVLDENGRDISRDPNASAMTGSKPGGVRATGYTNPTCTSWSVTTGETPAGDPSGASGSWLAAATSFCNVPARVYCFMRTLTNPLVPVRTTGKVMYVSRSGITLGGGIGPADALCNGDRPAGAGATRALLPLSTRPIAALLNSSTTYVRPDGQVIGTGASIVQGKLETGIWQFSDGSYDFLGAGLNVITGATLTTGLTVAPSASQTCNDWTAGSMTPVGRGYANYAGDYLWYAVGGIMCSQLTTFMHHLYCVEM